MKKAERIFLIVLDSVGIGSLPDAKNYGDEGANTLKSISASSKFNVPTLKKLGLLNIDGLTGGVSEPKAVHMRLMERSAGKDTTTGHWEIAGMVSEKPMPVFPEGFPESFIKEFEKAINSEVLVNKPYSGTEVIKEYGEEHIATKKPIVYTSADSVFQIAAHEEYYGLDNLYRICQTARGMLKGELGVGRVIARPFIGNSKEDFTRTSNRHDYSLEPPKDTMLDLIKKSGLDTVAIGKITDIFAGRGITQTVRTSGNKDGMAKTLEAANSDFKGLCFVNLVDFDMIYGHRNDTDGYAEALSEFDTWLGEFIKELGDNDVLMITADHGCDPGYPGTDHTREYIPLLIYYKGISPKNLGTRGSFADIGCTVCSMLGVKNTDLDGESFLGLV